MEKTKKWYASKGIWLGVIAFLTGALPMLAAFVEKNDFSASSYALLVVGTLKVLERVTSNGEKIAL